ncbi:MAG TPA: hypothetical protein VHX49_02625 [Candidatus Acidoferrales bacterium]|jgi:hypothetical protein|nr:hypothetical protein [Candidatus Acidoferrales bacterium]
MSVKHTPIWQPGLPLRRQHSFTAILLIPSQTPANICRMVLGKLLNVCEEELHKAARAIAAVWQMMGEADERALHMLFVFLGLR